ncbi:hypothetical protein ABZ766_19940 [Streptomyces sp. NPDC006670]|uniref:hypothetical protein n=1 Tax=Streptomyces sp. NPDC006670 TaxID=3154476 RepID=UPI0033C5C7DF
MTDTPDTNTSGHTTNYHAPVVNMHDGQHNVGINYGTIGDATAHDIELRAAVAELVSLLAELRPHLTPDQDRAVDRALPVLTSDPAALPERGGLVLGRLAQIAAAVGAVGQPAAEAVNRLLGLLGA